MSQYHIDVVWDTYHQQRSPQAREELILHYAPLVKYVAGRVSNTVPAEVDVNDIISCGVLGLIDAVEKFDPGRGLKFETYATTRIRGAILDEFRRNDWMPRSVRQHQKTVRNATDALVEKLGRLPTEQEIVLATHLPVAVVRETASYIAASHVTSLDTSAHTYDGSSTVVKEIPSRDSAVLPDSILESMGIAQGLYQAIDALSDRERVLVALYYYDKMTLTEIGTVLGVSESRCSQMHSKIVRTLKEHLSTVFQGDDV